MEAGERKSACAELAKALVDVAGIKPAPPCLQNPKANVLGEKKREGE